MQSAIIKPKPSSNIKDMIVLDLFQSLTIETIDWFEGVQITQKIFFSSKYRELQFLGDIMVIDGLL